MHSGSAANGSVSATCRRSGVTGMSTPAIAATFPAHAPAAFTTAPAPTSPRVRLHAPPRAVADADAAHGGAVLEAHAQASRGLRVAAQHLQRADEAVRRAVDAAHQPLRRDRGVDPQRLVHRHPPRLVHAQRALHGLRFQQRRKLLLALRRERGSRRDGSRGPRPPRRRSAAASRARAATGGRWAQTRTGSESRRSPCRCFPAPHRARASSTSTRVQPRAARCHATLAPITPPPTITTSYVSTAPPGPGRLLCSRE